MSEQDQPETISILREIERFGAAQPFVPFVIVMTSGTRYDISLHDTVIVGQNVIIVVRPREGHHVLRQNAISEVSLPGDE